MVFQARYAVEIACHSEEPKPTKNLVASGLNARCFAEFILSPAEGLGMTERAQRHSKPNKIARHKVNNE
jgi:hypothetical protein